MQMTILCAMMPCHGRKKMLVQVFFVLWLAVIVGFVSAAELVEQSIEHDSLQRWFLEYEPKTVTENPALVILLHGGTQSMRKLFRRSAIGSSRWQSLSDTHGFVLLVPNGVNIETGDTYGDDQNWSDLRTIDDPSSTALVNDDVGFITKLVQYAVTEYNVNPSKVYVTGSSNGGIMTYTMLLKEPNLFAAGAAFIANLPSFTIPYANGTTPIMIMNGNKDRLMKWEGGTVPSDVGGSVRSASDTRDFWIQNNNARTDNVIYSTLPNRNWFDRCRIRSEFYFPNPTPLSDSASVLFYLMDGGGHSMPSRRGFFRFTINLYDILIGGPSCHDANGADLAWDFMSAHTL